ncbi:CJ058 protein [Salmo salar]|uniref:C10orf58 homolog n=1 Tax=Salmo salar TaxID=8030 RepID=B5X802_SALSA|nr:CJ058 protein [Salmo salar]ACI66972.1 C10orf58 homolog precursor [Salmo salar]|eukprot:NP_001134301.1 CJ058 protein [Salmo salar]
MGMWSLGLGTLGVAIVGIFLANTDLCLTKAAQASLEYLEDADLRSTGNDENTISPLEDEVDLIPIYFLSVWKLQVVPTRQCSVGLRSWSGRYCKRCVLMIYLVK